MKKLMPFVAGLVALIALLAGMALTQTPVPGASSADLESTAKKIVTQSAGIKQGDIVLISGSIKDLELLEDIAVNVRARGAFPLLTVTSQRLSHRLYTDVPSQFDSQNPELDLKLIKMVNAIINVYRTDSLELFADIPAERIAAQAKAYVPVNQLLNRLGIRQVSIGNGLFPTPAVARMYGVTVDELARQFWGGVNTDYTKLEARGKAIRSFLASAKEVHVTNPNGTDLRARISGRPVFVSDGVISDEDLKIGPAGATVWLPAGEVYMAPVRGTAGGRVVIDRLDYQGEAIMGLTLDFKAGKLVSMTAKSGLESLKRLYDAAGQGKDEFAILDFGINPDVRMIPNSNFLSWVQAGMVSIGFGDNTWAGGDNASSFSLAGFVPGCSVMVDGKPFVDKGELQM